MPAEQRAALAKAVSAYGGGARGQSLTVQEVIAGIEGHGETRH